MSAEKKLIQNFTLVPGNGDNFLFEQREMLISHSAFQKELSLICLIMAGDVESLTRSVEERSQEDVHVGKLSDDPLVQSKYCAVALMALGCRAAILGGVIESDAYNYSDVFIRNIDKMKSPDEVYGAIQSATLELVKMVRASRVRSEYPESVKNCINFISDHIHYKLTLPELAKHCGLSPSYLSSLFKKATGMTICSYVMHEKLLVARSMLISGKYGCVDVANYLGFCSQSHFCECFKKEFGHTPTNYLKK